MAANWTAQPESQRVPLLRNVLQLEPIGLTGLSDGDVSMCRPLASCLSAPTGYIKTNSALRAAQMEASCTKRRTIWGTDMPCASPVVAKIDMPERQMQCCICSSPSRSVDVFTRTDRRFALEGTRHTKTRFVGSIGGLGTEFGKSYGGFSQPLNVWLVMDQDEAGHGDDGSR